MELRQGHGSPPDLSGLDLAIRLKRDLCRRIAASSPAEWPRHLAWFVAALGDSSLRDRTALVVLLTELRQELREFAARGKPRSEVDPPMLFDPKTGSECSSEAILRRFQRAVATDLRFTVGLLSVPNIVPRAMRFIDDHYAEPITVARIAAAVRRSRKHLGTLFRRHTGLTVHEYLIRVRLRHALAFIRDGEKIEAVSLLVGYRSKKNFYRHFKSHVGATPIEYRTELARAARGAAFVGK